MMKDYPYMRVRKKDGESLAEWSKWRGSKEATIFRTKYRNAGEGTSDEAFGE